MVIVFTRKYSSASSWILSRTPGRSVTVSLSAYFSRSLEWTWTLAAVNAGLATSPAAMGGMRGGSVVLPAVGVGAAPAGAGLLGAAWAGAGGAAVAVPPLLAGAGVGTPAASGARGAPVWLALTLSSRPILS